MAHVDGLLNAVYSYHEATKHHPHRYARSAGYMDWATQPHPFLRFSDAPQLALPPPAADPDPGWPAVLAGAGAPAPLTAATVSGLFWTSLAISAWKQVKDAEGRVVSRWSLRVNPSSGNLHPTEGWLACGAVEGLADAPALHHYRADTHALERVADIEAGVWNEVVGPDRLLFGLSSIAWRESWKYGERAYRYCNHDVGHALAAVDLAAAALGWRVRMRDDLGSELVGRFLGCDRRVGPEWDHPDAVLEVLLGAVTSDDEVTSDIDRIVAATGEHAGPPDALSLSHQPWEAIDEAIEAAVWPGLVWPPRETAHVVPAPGDASLPFVKLVRDRRSAVDMDGRTVMTAAAFYELLGRLMPDRTPRPFDLLPWPPAVSLALFVHRIEGLEPGLHLLVRNPEHEARLRSALDPDFFWDRPDGCPADLPLFRLRGGDVRAWARDIACRQHIAADGAFAVAMLADFAGPLATHGPGMYPRLFWETGAVGQMLYLGAEAAGLQGTGIGCFFDDVMHEVLGLEGNDWQSLYHFTVGKGVMDSRVESTAAYGHLEG